MKLVMDICILFVIFCLDKNDFERDERSKYLIWGFDFIYEMFFSVFLDGYIFSEF